MVRIGKELKRAKINISGKLASPPPPREPARPAIAREPICLDPDPPRLFVDQEPSSEPIGGEISDPEQDLRDTIISGFLGPETPKKGLWEDAFTAALRDPRVDYGCGIVTLRSLAVKNYSPPSPAEDLKARAVRVLEPGRKYDREEVLEALEQSGLSAVDALRIFYFMLEVWVLERGLGPDIFYLGGSSPYPYKIKT